MKISIITVCFNSATTIADTIRSVANQTYDDIEYMVIDGGSTDGTQEIIGKHLGHIAKFISEPDKGIYDAMNKGIAMANGDIIGILNSDDIYAHENVLKTVAEKMQHSSADALFGDVAFFRGNNYDDIVRYYNSGFFTPARMAYGWMPAHPAMFLRKKIYDITGEYKTDYSIAADYEFIIRAFVIKKFSYQHLPEILVKMRTGGISTAGWKSNILSNKEMLRACRENGISTNIFKICSKYPLKLLGLLKRGK